MTAVLARVAMAVAALLVGAWLVHSLHAVQLQNEANRIAPGPPAPRPSPQAFARAQSLLRRATRANPDLTPDLELAGSLLYAGRTHAAIAMLEGLVRKEPDNTEALFSLLVGAQKVDPSQSAAARRRLMEIAPPPPGG